MKKNSSAWLVGATVALVAALFSASLPAQTQPNLSQLAQLSQPQTAEALLALPEAPGPQNGAPAASASSSSSQEAALAAGPAATPAVAPTPASTPPAATATGSETKQEEHDKAERELKLEEQQHLLGVVPNFNVVLNGQALPLTGSQKWDLALHSVVDPFYFGWAFAVGGGFSELIDSNSGYGWGPLATSSASAPTTPTTSTAS